MDCLNDNQIILYLTQFGLGDEERAKFDDHLNGCERCRERKQKLEQKVKASLTESQAECKRVRTNLAAYVDGEIQSIAGINIEQHLNECEMCNFLFQRLQKCSNRDEIQALNITVPETLLPNILETISQEIKQETRRGSLITPLAEKMLEGIDQIINYIEISLLPLEVKPVLLGKRPYGAKKITHPGGDLLVDVGAKDITIKIFSLDDVELGDQKSDNQGQAIFKDFEPAEYKIVAEGFKIDKVRYVT